MWLFNAVNTESMPWLQDLFILLICASAVYLLRARDLYELVPAWRKDIDMDHFQNGKYPSMYIMSEVTAITFVITVK